MAGPGIRYHNIAKVLDRSFKTSVGLFSDEVRDSDYQLVSTRGDDFKQLFDNQDIIFAQWLSNEMIEYSLKKGKILIFDLYAPVPIEYLASMEFSPNKISARTNEEFRNIVNMYNHYLRNGRFFTCSNERQRDFWTGFLTANNILTPNSFAKNHLLDKFALCPMGISETPPKKGKLLLRGSFKGIHKDDFVLLWTGGIWDWFDAQLVIKAMARLSAKPIKLVFLGTHHPNSKIGEMSESVKAKKLAGELGLLDKSVFFLEGWIDYEKRAQYFQDADAAIYADKESLETRFSHRTRVLDHIWTELPTICSPGDTFSDIIRQNHFGVVAETRTPEAFVAAIEKLISDKALYKRIKTSLHAKKHDFTWEKTLSPLVDYIEGLDIEAESKLIKKSAASLRAKSINVKHRAKAAAKVLLGRA